MARLPKNISRKRIEEMNNRLSMLNDIVGEIRNLDYDNMSDVETLSDLSHKMCKLKKGSKVVAFVRNGHRVIKYKKYGTVTILDTPYPDMNNLRYVISIWKQPVEIDDVTYEYLIYNSDKGIWVLS